MLKDKMQQALNEQINAELYSSYMYLAMSAYFEAQSLKGFSNWMRVQAQEELLHVVKFFDFINDRSGRAVLSAVAAPPKDWDGPLAAFEAVYQHECEVSDLINKLVDVARELSDHATYNFLQWFVAEQVEEEASVDQVVQHLKLVGKDNQGLFLIDRELATRVFTPPPAAGAAAGG
jgi:ferritin